MTSSRINHPVAQPPRSPDNRSANDFPNPVPQPPPSVPLSAARRRISRKVVLLAVAVVLFGGVVSVHVGQSLTKRITVLAVSQPVARGSVISESDLTTAEVAADPALRPVEAKDRGVVVGKVALQDLSVGELLTRSQFGASDGFVPGTMIVAIPLKDGQLPARGLAPGDKVLIIDTPGQLGVSDATGGAATASTSTSAEGIDAIVASVGPRSDGTTLTVVDVRVDSADGVAVAKLASTGRATLILLPPGK